jgi:flagellin-like protein
MKESVGIFSGRKGITPIIATVLLLGITVAIGLTVYTQAQGMIGNTDTSSIDRVQNTDIALTPVYNDGDEMQLQVSNKGDRAINVSKFTVYYGPPNWDPVTYSTITSQAPNWEKDADTSTDGNTCFTDSMSDSSLSNSILEPGERASCDTGVKFPGALEAVEIRVEADNFDYSTSSTCSAETESAQSC